MKTSKEQGLNPKKDPNRKKDNKQYPESQFSKEQRKDAEKGLLKNDEATSKDEKHGGEQ